MKYFNRRKASGILAWLIFGTIWIIFVQVLFCFFLFEHTKVIQEGIGSSLRQASGVDSLKVVEGISEFSRANLIRCLVAGNSNDPRVADFSFEGNCAPRSWLLEGETAHIKVATLEGNVWNLKFTVLPPTGFTIALWIVRLTGLMILALTAYGLEVRSRAARDHLMLEIKRADEIESMARQVGHDVRSPLGVLGIVIKKYLDPKTEAYEASSAAISRIEQIASDLLQRETENQQFQAIDVQALVNEVIRAKGQATPGVEWKTRIRITRANLSISPTALYRVISNLVQNSIDALASNSKPEVVIDVLRDGTYLAVEVRDFGKGIPEDILRVLREKEISYGKIDGHGLGVSHARAIATKANGTFTIECPPGGGTKAVLRLPLL